MTVRQKDNLMFEVCVNGIAIASGFFSSNAAYLWWYEEGALPSSSWRRNWNLLISGSGERQ